MDESRTMVEGRERLATGDATASDDGPSSASSLQSWSRTLNDGKYARGH